MTPDSHRDQSNSPLHQPRERRPPDAEVEAVKLDILDYLDDSGEHVLLPELWEEIPADRRTITVAIELLQADNRIEMDGAVRRIDVLGGSP